MKTHQTTTFKATERLLDSVWTVEFTLSNGMATIIRHSREDQEGYDKERELPQFTLIETKERIVTRILIRDAYSAFDWVNEENCSQGYEVVNPKHVFSYNGPDLIDQYKLSLARGYHALTLVYRDKWEVSFKVCTGTDTCPHFARANRYIALVKQYGIAYGELVDELTKEECDVLIQEGHTLPATKTFN